MTTFRLPRLCAAAALHSAVLFAPPAFAQAQKSVVSAPSVSLTYADMADMALAARIVALVKIRNATTIKAEQAINLTPGRKRYLVEADVTTLIRGDGGLVPRITFLADVAPDTRGKLPKLSKAVMLVMALPVAGQANAVRLVSPDAMVPATPGSVAQVRSILSQAVAADAPPAIAAISDVYHVAGTIAGEGETQIFLQTKNGLPVSISINRATGMPASWSVALGELIDQGAPPPQRDTLLWYRLACFLPRALPAETLVDLSPDDSAAAQMDYGVVMTGLGACPRTLKIRP